MRFPLETFTEAIDMLSGECERIVLIGLSYGAEAALLTACVDDRVDAVVALAPTDVAWEGRKRTTMTLGAASPSRPYQVGGDEDAPQRLGALA